MSDAPKERVNPEFEWCDTKTFIVDDKGKLVEAGTCLLLQGQVIFLGGLSLEQLQRLKSSVLDSVDHEISKRTTNT